MAKVEDRVISHEEYLTGKYQSVTHRDGKYYARIYKKDSGGIDEENTYSTEYKKKHGIGRYAEKPKKEAKPKKQKNKSRSNRDDDPIWVKIVFTIIPILPIWYILKCPFYLISLPFRKLFSCKNQETWPKYSFKKF